MEIHISPEEIICPNCGKRGLHHPYDTSIKYGRIQNVAVKECKYCKTRFGIKFHKHLEL